MLAPRSWGEALEGSREPWAPPAPSPDPPKGAGQWWGRTWDWGPSAEAHWAELQVRQSLARTLFPLDP